MKLKYFSMAVMGAVATTMTAQTIDFETEDWKSIGVYDTWEQSPFRQKQLAGNVKVVDNPAKNVLNIFTQKADNPSDKVLAVQRSRFGSNTFGARIDLKETFELTPKGKYVHVWFYREKSGRVMLVGLGKRRDRTAQSPETEQFYAMTTEELEGGAWKEAVFFIKGNGGIDIHSLVVIPDCESPHNLKQDFAAYIDHIVIDDSPKSEIVNEYYFTNFGKDKPISRNDRALSNVHLKTSTGDHSVRAVPKVLHSLSPYTFVAKLGETVTPKVTYKGSWMNAYCYLDVDNNGLFTLDTPQELLSYSFLSDEGDPNVGKNSAGKVLKGAGRNTLVMPPFKVPEDLKPGYYRMRYKVDWNSSDPAGSTRAGNDIVKNGGGMVDIRLNVHADSVHISDGNLNGFVANAEGQQLQNLKVPFGKPYKITMRPENGFEYQGVKIRYGYNLQGAQVIRDNVQWEEVYVPRDQFDETDHSYVIPAEYMQGDVSVEGLFIQIGNYRKPETRFKTTRIIDGAFAPDTQWYTITIGRDNFVLSDHGSEPHIALNNTKVDINDPAQLWCFVGSEEVGYKIYNCKTGVEKVLAAPTEMKAAKGGNAFPILEPKNDLLPNYTTTWRFENSNKLGAGEQFVFLYEDGSPEKKVNNRSGKFAFWTGGADAGSTLTVTPARTTNPTGMRSATADNSSSEGYALDGRRVTDQTRGVVVKKGLKLMVR